MPITDAQRELRRKHLGSSDVAAILGVDPYKNAYDVWAEKTGKVEDIKESDAMYAGTAFEDGVLKFAEDKLGKLVRNQYRSAQGFPIAANIDAIVVKTSEPVEAKTAGLFGPLQEHWGDASTDEVPDRVIVQAHVHMLCVSKEICHVPAFLGGRGFIMFQVARDDEIINTIGDKSIDFWDNFVEADCPPPDVIPSMSIIKRMKREPEKVVDIDSVLIEHWQKAVQSRKAAEEIEAAAKEQMLVALGDAEAGRCELGLLTYLQQTTKRIDSKRLKDEKPEIAKEYTTVSIFRVPRLKKPKPSKGAIL